MHIYLDLQTDVSNDKKKKNLVSCVNSYDTPGSEINMIIMNYPSNMLRVYKSL